MNTQKIFQTLGFSFALAHCTAHTNTPRPVAADSSDCRPYPANPRSVMGLHHRLRCEGDQLRAIPTREEYNRIVGDHCAISTNPRISLMARAYTGMEWQNRHSENVLEAFQQVLHTAPDANNPDHLFVSDIYISMDHYVRYGDLPTTSSTQLLRDNLRTWAHSNRSNPTRARLWQQLKGALEDFIHRQQDGNVSSERDITARELYCWMNEAE